MSTIGFLQSIWPKIKKTCPCWFSAPQIYSPGQLRRRNHLLTQNKSQVSWGYIRSRRMFPCTYQPLDMFGCSERILSQNEKCLFQEPWPITLKGTAYSIQPVNACSNFYVCKETKGVCWWVMPRPASQRHWFWNVLWSRALAHNFVCTGLARISVWENWKTFI